MLAASQTAVGPQAHEAVEVIARLRMSLVSFAGADGFTALLRRAVVLASADIPELKRVTVGADGQLTGLEGLADAGPGTLASDAAIEITTQLLGLLMTFIGEPLTLTLLRGAWPDASLDESHPKARADS